jgi:hypothetical protein
MRVVLAVWLVCFGVVHAGVAHAAPRNEVSLRLAAAVAFEEKGEYEKALAELDAGLVLAPRDRRLLKRKGRVLVALRDDEGTLAVYEAFLQAGATGQERRDAERLVEKLRVVKTTFLDVTLANGPADVYLDTKTLGKICTAAPSCRKGLQPRVYRVIVERPGYEDWVGRVTVAKDTTETLVVTLTEKPSQLTVRVAQPGARVTVDDAPYAAPTKVPPGEHKVAVALAGHVTARRDVTAREGKPIDLDVALTPLVPVRVEPPGAALLLDGKPVEIEDGGILVPPGDHVVKATLAGHDDGESEIPAERPAGFAVAITLSPKPIPPPPSRLSSGLPGIRKIAIGAGGVALVAGASGVVLGLLATARDEEARELCPSPETSCAGAARANELNQEARSRALQANIGYGIAGGAALAAAVLWFSGARESHVAVAPRVGGAVTGLDLAVRF